MKETPKKNRNQTSFFHKAVSWLAVYSIFVSTFTPPFIGTARANPGGGAVVGGSATISGQGTSSVTVNQSSNRAVINWNSFSVGAGERTQFVQPNSNSVAFNRVTGASASQILGSVTANGKIIIANPNGIVFGAGSRVDAAGLVATTQDADSAAFMAGGPLRFTKRPGAPDNASVVNQGTISIKNAGMAAFVAPSVRNDGVIVADLGQVALASGKGFTLDMYGDNLVSFAVGDEITETLTAADGTPLKALVENTGTIKGSSILLTANVARSVVNNAVNVSGTLQADSAKVNGGKIVLSSSNAAGEASGVIRVENAFLSAMAPKATGGDVKILGEKVGVAKSTIDVSGKTGGGAVRIGGGFQGGEGLKSATTTIIDKDTKIKADATNKGKGGFVVVWSDDATHYQGSISAKGGSKGGNGGDVEVSGKQTLAFVGIVDVSAPKGYKGNLLLDPAGLVISDDPDDFSCDGFLCAGDGTLNTGTLETLLASGNVTIQSAFDISILGDIEWSTDSLLMLQAENSIFNAATIRNDYAGSFENGRIPVLLALRADSKGTNGGFGVDNNSGVIDFENSTGAVSVFRNLEENSGFFAQGNVLLNGGWTAPDNHTVDSQLTDYQLLNTAEDVKSLLNGNYNGTLVAYALGGDISFADFSYSAIGQADFIDATLDGQYCALSGGSACRIYDLVIDSDNGYAVGLFEANKGILRNLVLDMDIELERSGAELAGLLAASNDGLIANVKVYGTAEFKDHQSNGGYLYVGALSGVSRGMIVGAESWMDLTVTSDTTDVYAGGLVGVISNSTVTLSHAFEDVSVITSRVAAVGGLSGLMDDGAFLTGSSAHGNLSAVSTGDKAFAGGLTGLMLAGSTVSNSYSVANVYAETQSDTPSAAGGLTAVIDSSNILESYAAGDVMAKAATLKIAGEASAYAGGLAGETTNGYISSSFATGIVEGDAGQAAGAELYLGGLVGYMHGTIENSYATGVVRERENHNTTVIYAAGLIGLNMGTVKNSYSTAAVYHANSAHATTLVGGLVGKNGGSVSNSYWDTETSGQQASDGGDGVLTADLQHALDASWDTNIWGIITDLSNPYLQWQVDGATPYVIAGFAYDGFSNAAAGGGSPVGAVVQGYLNGADFGQRNGTVHVGANGYYYFLLPANSLDNTFNAVTYLRDGNSASFMENMAPGSYNGLYGTSYERAGTPFAMFENTLRVGAYPTAAEATIDLTLTNLWETIGEERKLFFDYDVDGATLTMDRDTTFMYASLGDGVNTDLSAVRYSTSGNGAIAVTFINSNSLVVSSIDPGGVSFMDAGLVEDWLNQGSNVMITSLFTDLSLNREITWGQQSRLVLNAGKDVILNRGITNTYNSDMLSPDPHYIPVLLGIRADVMGYYLGGTITNNAVIDFSNSTGAISFFHEYGHFMTPGTIHENPHFAGAANGSVSTQVTTYQVVSNMDDFPKMDTSDANGVYALGGTLGGLGADYQDNTGFDGNKAIIDGQYCYLAGGSTCGIRDFSLGGVQENVGLFETNTGILRNLTVDLDISIGAAGSNYRIGGLVAFNQGVVFNSTSAGSIYVYEDASSIVTMGGLVGENGSKIQSSRSFGQLGFAGIQGYTFAGGLVGRNESVISDSMSSVNINGLANKNAGIGGLTALITNGATVERSYANGNITDTHSNTVFAGGLVGASQGLVTQSFAVSNMLVGAIDSASIGGLIGITDSGSQVDDTYSMGSVTIHSDFSGADYSVGGLIGTAAGEIYTSYTTTYLADVGSYAGSVNSAIGKDVGLINVVDLLYDADTIGINSGPGSGLSTTEMQSGLPDTFDGDIWGILPEVSYAYFKWQVPADSEPQVVAGIYKNDDGHFAGQTIHGLVDGKKMSSLLTGGSVRTAANGYYYYLLAPETISPSLSNVAVYHDERSAASYIHQIKKSVTDLYIADGVLAIRNEYSAALSDATGGLYNMLGDDAYKFFFRYDGSLLDMRLNKNLHVIAGTNALSLDDNIRLAGPAAELALQNRNLIHQDAPQRIITPFLSVVNGNYDLQGSENQVASFIGAAEDTFLYNSDKVDTLILGYTGSKLVLSTPGAMYALGGIQAANLLLLGGAYDFSANAGHSVATLAAAADQVAFHNGSAMATNIGSVDGTEGIQAGYLMLDGSIGSSFTQSYAIVAPHLALGTGGLSRASYTLNHSSNAIDILSGWTNGVINFTENSGFDIGTTDFGAGITAGNLYLTTGSGNVTQTQRISAGTLLLKSSGGNYSLTHASNAINTLAVNVGAGSVRFLENSGFGIGSVNGTLGVTAGNLWLTSNSTVNQSQAVSAATATFSGSGAYALTGSGNNIGTISANTGSLSLNNGGNALTVGSVNSVSGVTTTGATSMVNAGLITLNQGVTAGGAGTSITLSGTGFDNNAGVNALNAGAGGGRFLVWSATPASDDRGGIAHAFKQYNATYGVTTVLGSGSGFLYTLAPTVSTSLQGTVTKQYDATTAATLTGANYGAVTGAVDGDTVTLTNPTAGTYDSANAGGGKTVSVGASTVDTATNGAVTVYGYQVGATPSAIIGQIDKRVLTIDGNFTANNKQYDATTAATFLANGLTLVGVQNSEDVSLSGATIAFADANKGTGKTVSLTGGSLAGSADLDNYTLSFTNAPTATADIAARVLTIGGSFTANNKEYDATTAATFLANGLTLVGVQNSEDVSLSGATIAFADANKGDGKIVSLTGGSLAGSADLSNYTLSFTGAPTTTADIAARVLTLGGNFTANNKVYDGSSAASYLVNGLTLIGVQNSEDVILSGSSISFDDANVGNGKTVSVTAGTLGGSADLSNYTLSLAGAPGATADITPATLQVTITGNFTVANKMYDGTTAATINSNNLLLLGVQGLDDVSLLAVASFLDANAGLGKTVTLLGSSLDGADAGNYILDFTGAPSATADIARRVLTIGGGFTAQNKLYDGTAAAAFASNGLTLLGVQNSEDVTLSASTIAFASAAAGNGKTVSVTAGTLGGAADLSNYTLSLAGAPTAAANITPVVPDVPPSEVQVVILNLAESSAPLPPPAEVVVQSPFVTETPAPDKSEEAPQVSATSSICAQDVKGEDGVISISCSVTD